MVKLVAYPDSSEDEQDAQDEQDARSDSSHWSSFGQLPSDSEDSLSFPMRSPESERDDSDEDYAPSEVSESSADSIATEDLEFPTEMEQEQEQEQVQEQDQKGLFYAWEDLREAFEDNPFKRRSVGGQESGGATEESEEVETSTESPADTEDNLETDGDELKTARNLNDGSATTASTERRKILRPRKPTRPTGASPRFSNLSMDNQGKKEKGDGGVQWDQSTVVKQEAKTFPTPEDTTTSVYTFSASQAESDAFSFGSKQTKAENASSSTAGFSFGKPSPKLFTKRSDDTHMMSPPPPVATAAPASSSSEFTFGRSEHSPKPFNLAGSGTFRFSATVSSSPNAATVRNNDGGDAQMGSPSLQAYSPSPTDDTFTIGERYKNRKPFQFVEQSGNEFHFGPSPDLPNVLSKEATLNHPPRTSMPVESTSTTRFGINDTTQPSVFFSPGVASPTQRSRNGRRRKLNGSSSMFSSAPTTNQAASKETGAQSVPAPFTTAGGPSRHFSRESSFIPPAGPTREFTEETFANDTESISKTAVPPPANPQVGSTGGHFLFRKANPNSARPSPLQTNAFGITSDSAASATPDTTTAAQFSLGTRSLDGPEQSGESWGTGRWFSASKADSVNSTTTGFRIGTADAKATSRVTRVRHLKGGMFASKNSPKRPTNPAVVNEPEPSPSIFSSSTATSSASPFGMRSSRASKSARVRKRMGRSPPADPFVVPTFQNPQPSSSSEEHPVQPNAVRPTANWFTFEPPSTADNQSSSAATHAREKANQPGMLSFQPQNQQQSSVPPAGSSIFTSPTGVDRTASSSKPQRVGKSGDESFRPAFAGSRRILHAALRNVGARPSGAMSAPLVNKNYKFSSHVEDKGDSDMTIEEDENDWGELKRLGGVAYSSRRYSDAAEFYRQSIEVLESLLEHNADMTTHELMTDKAKLHANRAACLMMLTQIPEAQRECRRSIEVDPTYARAYIRLGRIQILLGDTTNAQANLETAQHLIAGDMGIQGISNDQADAAQLHKMEASIKKLVTLRGEIKWYTDCGDYKQALLHTENALLIALSSRKLQVQKARILLHQKEFDQIVELCTAIVHKQQAIHDKSSKGGWNAHSLKENTVDDITFVGIDLGLLWATSLHYRNCVDDAVRILEALEIVAPCSSHVIQLKHQWRDMKKLKHNGNERFKRGEYQEAVRYYSEAVQIDPQHEEYCAIIFCNRAAAQMALERYHTAILDCNEALQRKPKYSRALLRRARCHVALKMFHEAVKDFDQYLREHPADSSSDIADDVRRERNEAKAAIAKAREEARQREATKKRAEREQRQRRQQRWENPWDDTKFYENFRRGASSNGNRYKPSGPSGPSGRSSFMAPKTQRRTHYDVLGIEKSATVDDIKKAYRKLALVYHPDKAKTSTHADLFKDMTAAYNVLSDESARTKYDRELIYNRFGNFYES